MVEKIYECCIFDLDGILLDTSCGLLNSLDYTIKNAFYRLSLKKSGCSMIGPPIKFSLKKQYGLYEAADKSLAVFCEYYETKELFSASLYSSIPALLDHFGVAKYFNFIGCADPAGKMTKTDILNLCADKLNGGRKKGILIIGSEPFDTVGAMEVHMDFLAETYGFGFKNMKVPGAVPNVGICNSVREVGDSCGLY